MRANRGGFLNQELLRGGQVTYCRAVRGRRGEANEMESGDIG